MTHQETLLLNSFSTADSPRVAAAPEGGSLPSLAVLLLSYKRLIGGATLAASLIAAVAVQFMPPIYSAEASILPPQQQQSSLAALASGALGGIAGGMGAQVGVKNSSDLYIGLLKSRTISEEIIKLFNLGQVYKTKLASSTRKKLAQHVSFSASKESLIMISCKDENAQRAAAIANAYVEELYKENSKLALSEAAQRRLFFEQQLKSERDALANAEIALKQTQQATGMIVPTGQAEVLLRSAAQVRAEIASRRVQLQAVRSYATDENPQVKLLQSEITALEAQGRQVESSDTSGSGLEISGARLPAASLEYVRRLRDLKYHETLFELLAKQYEGARIDESKQAPVIQVIDRAVVPDRDSRSRTAIVIAVGLATLLLSCVLIVLRKVSRNFLLEVNLHRESMFTAPGLNKLDVQTGERQSEKGIY